VPAGLAGALCGYLVLFGPLALIPQVLTSRGIGEAHAGVLLTALPAGFALAALTADRVLPHRLGNRRRCLAGGALATLAAGCLTATSVGSGLGVTLLAVLGIGLGLFIPANNTAIMAAVPARLSGTAGGMVNMTRGAGTALGIAVVTLALHLAGVPGETGTRIALGAITAVAVLATVTGLTARTPETPGPA
jgi:MFS family permease